MRKRYKYVVYTNIMDEEETWGFTAKEKEFYTKREAVDYILNKEEKETDTFKLDCFDIAYMEGGIGYKNLKTNTVTWLASEEV